MNDRLGNALSAAKSMKKSNAKTRRKYAFEDPEVQRRVQAMRILKPKKPECTYMRIQLDAKKLAEQAWPDSFEKVEKSSEAIRIAAKKSLGL